MRQKPVFIPSEKPLLDYGDWDPIREQARWAVRRDDKAFAAQLREYAQRVAVYAVRSLMKNPGSAADAEWYDAVISRVMRVAAMERSPRPRKIHERQQQQALLYQCYTEMAVLLLAWSAIVEARERGYVDQGFGGTVADEQTAPADNDGR
jgi:hypothetical protein